MNQNVIGHGPACSSTPPITGAMAGASEKIIITRLISRWASGPSNTSRMTVRLTITPPPALSPCSTRNTSRLSRVGDRAQPTEART